MDQTKDPKQFRDLLNASGFAFQLAVEAAVRSSPGHLGWSVAAREHPWQSSSESGYIDIVVSNGRMHLVVECKRTRDAVWMFLLPDQAQLSRSHARICWTDTVPNRPPLTGWGDIQVYPASPEADFCVIRGQGERDKPLLERLGAAVVEATDGLALQLLQLSPNFAHTKIVLPVIVTNATLMVASFAPRDVSLVTGELDSAAFQILPHVRFRKSLAAASAPEAYEPDQLRDLGAESERTVFVVNASYFREWLDTFQVNVSSTPWQAARALAGGV